MAIVNGYATLAEVKARLGITDSTYDSVLEAVVEAASRGIDNYADRRFYAATETRYFTACDSTYALIDDVVSVTTLATDNDGNRAYGTTWASTDYDLSPFNAIARGAPYTRIDVAPLGSKTFPLYTRAVKVVGSFGYAAAVPDVINEAALILSARFFRRKDSPLGVAGFGDLGAIRVSTVDPDVKTLLAPLRRIGLA